MTITLSTINSGTVDNDGTGDTLKVAAGKINDNFGIVKTAVDNLQVKDSFITVTQAVDLDSIESRVNFLDAVVILMGTWNAATAAFPAAAQAGYSYIVSAAGTVGGIAFAVNDRLICLVDNASTTVYASNWYKTAYTDQVLSVNGQTGTVVISVATDTHASPMKTSPDDADEFPLVDIMASYSLKKISWASLKTALKNYFNTLYTVIPIAWTAFTPTASAATGTFTTVSAAGRYTQSGKLVHFNVLLTITTNGTAAGYITLITPISPLNANWAASGVSITTGKALSVQGQSGYVVIRLYDGTYPGGTGVVLNISGTYEAY
jgi:hypothetical protein